MSLRRFRRRGGGCLIRNIGTNYTINDVVIKEPKIENYTSPKKGFFYSSSYGVTCNPMNCIRVCYPNGLIPVIANSDNTILEDYLTYFDLTLYSNGDYVCFFIYPKNGSDTEVDFVCCVHIKYSTISNLKEDIFNIERLCASKAYNAGGDLTNVCFGISQVNNAYEVLPILKYFNYIGYAELAGENKEQKFWYSGTSDDYYGKFLYFPNDYPLVQWWIIENPDFLYGVNYSNNLHFKGVRPLLNGTHYLSNDSEILHFPLQLSNF